MDFLHRRPQHSDTRTGLDCQFCARLDPDFSTRKTMDKIVRPLHATASAHLTENGYVKHRMLELEVHMGKLPVRAGAA